MYLSVYELFSKGFFLPCSGNNCYKITKRPPFSPYSLLEPMPIFPTFAQNYSKSVWQTIKKSFFPWLG